MSLHIFGNILTQHAVAANNRAETEGNITTLQKILWKGQVHSTVSAEAIRFALRQLLASSEPTNRRWDEDARENTWQDHTFAGWSEASGETFIDDDLLGFMKAEAAKEEKGKKGKGTTTARRAVLEVTRAVSLTPWAGDVTFNAASPGATPSAAKKGTNPVPYGTELHATRYQYGFALTPERLRKPGRACVAVEKLCALTEVAGNQARFLYDFSPESAVFRVTQDPAPRLLYAFEADGDGGYRAPGLLRRVTAGDIEAGELIIAGAFADSEDGRALVELGALAIVGVRKAAAEVTARVGGGA